MTIVAAAAPPIYPTPPISIDQLGDVLKDGTAGDGRHIVLADDDGDHRIYLPDGRGHANAVLIPLDETFEDRLGVAARFFRRLRGEATGGLPPRLCVTAFQRLRLTTLLRCFDREAAGGTKREIAHEIIYPGLDGGSAAEWKASAERRRTQRLCEEARTMVAGGYKRLLGGG